MDDKHKSQFDEEFLIRFIRFTGVMVLFALTIMIGYHLCPQEWQAAYRHSTMAVCIAGIALAVFPWRAI